jgi:hypothetical protein
MVRACRVTIKDMEGVSHTADVTAETLYEAVALGLVALRGKDWVSGIAEGFNVVQVSVTDIPVKHSVTLKDFNAWLGRAGRVPKEITSRQRVKKILGL